MIFFKALFMQIFNHLFYFVEIQVCIIDNSLARRFTFLIPLSNIMHIDDFIFSRAL